MRDADEPGAGPATAFQGAEAKLLQAQRHLSALEAESSAWIDSNPCFLTTVQHLKTAVDDVLLVVNTPPPSSIALIAGDFFHNVRGALDFIAWQVFLSGGGDPRSRAAKDIYFPIVKDAEGWPKQAARKLPTASVDVIEAIASVQPFLQPDIHPHPLTQLAKCSNRDKHQDLHLVAIAAGSFECSAVYPPGMKSEEGMTVWVPDVGVPLTVGKHLFARLSTVREDMVTAVPRAESAEMDFKSASLSLGLVGASEPVPLIDLSKILAAATYALAVVRSAA